MKKQEQNTKETVSMLVYGYLVILFAGLPLYMQNKLVMIGNAKYLFFRNTTLVLGAFVVLAVLWQGIRGERKTKRMWKKTDVFMLLYLVSAIFSYGISPCRDPGNPPDTSAAVIIPGYRKIDPYQQSLGH